MRLRADLVPAITLSLLLFGLAVGRAQGPVAAAKEAKVEETKFSAKSGFFFAPFQLKVTCATPGSIILYTTNGDEPQITPGTSTEGPSAVELRIERTTVLRAAAFKEGHRASRV